MEQIAEVKSLLSSPKDIVILSHRNPDGDALGSSLGLYWYLKQLGHSITVIFPSEFPGIFSWMPDSDQVLIYDLDPEKVKPKIEQADLYFCLDFNSLDRIDKVGEMIYHSKKPKVMIDHHIDPEPFADYVYSDTQASSTSEMIYEFIGMLGDHSKMNTSIGDCLYTGIITDTGSFKYGTSPRLFEIVSELVRLGVDDYKLQDLIFNCFPEKPLRLLGHCLANRMEILDEYATGIITLTKRDYKHFNIQRGDTEGIVNYLLKMKKIKLAAFITEQPKIVKLSFRSKGDFSVQEIATKYFKGGGHKNASGGYSHQNLRQTLAKFKNILPEYKDQLQNL